MLPKPPRARARGYLVGPTSRQLDYSRTSIGGGPLPMPMSRRGTAKAVNSQQRVSLGTGLVNTKKEVVTAEPQPKPKTTGRYVGDRVKRPQKYSNRGSIKFERLRGITFRPNLSRGISYGSR